MIQAKIIGAGGYGGVGITELLLKHPKIDIASLVSLSDTGRLMSDVFPHLKGYCDKIILSPDDPRTNEAYDLVIYATPDKVSMETAGDEIKKGAKVIDYSGDFRFNSLERYKNYANFLGKDSSHKTPELLTMTQYGLTEIHEINEKNNLIGNPGCFAISCILALAPAIKSKIIDSDTIICDCKTGISGAGKKPNASFHYPNRYDNMNAYRLDGHQHLVEIEQELGLLANKDLKITFTAQAVPLCRGIMSVCYADIKDTNITDAIKIYNDFYSDHQFIRILEKNVSSSISDVRSTNYCNLVVDIDERTQKLRIISHIDNLMKGQAGNAMQVINHMFGFNSNTALDAFGQYP